MTLFVGLVLAVVVIALFVAVVNVDHDDVTMRPSDRVAPITAPYVPKILPRHTRVRLRQPTAQTEGIWLCDEVAPFILFSGIDIGPRYTLVRPINSQFQGQKLMNVRREDMELEAIDLSRGRR